MRGPRARSRGAWVKRLRRHCRAAAGLLKTGDCRYLPRIAFLQRRRNGYTIRRSSRSDARVTRGPIRGVPGERERRNRDLFSAAASADAPGLVEVVEHLVGHVPEGLPQGIAE